MLGGLLLAIAIAIAIGFAIVRPGSPRGWRRSGSAGARFFRAYQQAQRAYLEGDYETAAVGVDRLLAQRPEDPNVVLLRAHLYYCLEEYERARRHYARVLQLTGDRELTDYALKGIENVNRASDRPD